MNLLFAFFELFLQTCITGRVEAYRAVDWATVKRVDLDRDREKRRKDLEKIFEQYCEVWPCG